MRKKLQNSKSYAESLEFLPALGLFILTSSPLLQLEVNQTPSSLDYKKKLVHIYIHGTNQITLHCSLARMGNNTSCGTTPLMMMRQIYYGRHCEYIACSLTTNLQTVHCNIQYALI